jgi:hypothetical protein
MRVTQGLLLAYSEKLALTVEANVLGGVQPLACLTIASPSAFYEVGFAPVLRRVMSESSFSTLSAGSGLGALVAATPRAAPKQPARR